MKAVAQKYIVQVYQPLPLDKSGDGKGICEEGWKTREYTANRYSENNNIGLNLKLSKLIRKFVKDNIKTNSIQAFGGESYLYSDNKKDTLCYTNSQSILSDIKYNGYENIKKVDYNKEKFFFINDDIVLKHSNLQHAEGNTKHCLSPFRSSRVGSSWGETIFLTI